MKLHLDWVTFFILAALIAWMSAPAKTDPKSGKFLTPPPEYIEYFSFGFSESIADSLWLRWIQDNDYCQTYKLAQKIEPIVPKAGEFYSPRHKFCDNSWGLKMLDAVTRLSPRFKMPYMLGAMSLSVITEDYEGAKLMFDRGVEAYPNDWTIQYRAAYHYLFDRHDLKRAAELLNHAGDLPNSPFWLKLLAAKLLSKTGQLQLGISTLENYRKTVTDEKVAKSVDLKIEELKKQLTQ